MKEASVMSWLVTGAGGFVGGHIARGLAQRGHRVYALSRSAKSLAPQTNGVIVPMPLDIRDIAQHSPKEPIDAVVHCAALSPADTDDEDLMHDVNVRGSRLLAEWSARHNVPFFVHLSSVSIYGQAQGCIDESSPIVDPDAYGASKHMAEEAIADARPDLSCVSLRLPGVLGKGAHNIWLSHALDTLRTGKSLTYYHKDAPFNNAVHVDDLLTFIFTLSKRPDRTHRLFTLGAGSAMTVAEVLEHMKRLLVSRSPLSEQPAKKPAFYIDCSLAQQAGYAPMHMKNMLERYVRESTPAAS